MQGRAQGGCSGCPASCPYARPCMTVFSSVNSEKCYSSIQWMSVVNKTVNNKSWNYMQVRKWLQISNFWLNYPFKQKSFDYFLGFIWLFFMLIPIFWSTLDLNYSYHFNKPIQIKISSVSLIHYKPRLTLFKPFVLFTFRKNLRRISDSDYSCSIVLFAKNFQ